MYPSPGGSPYTTAIAAARLDGDVQFLGRLSKDFFGEMLIKHLEQNKVSTDLIVRSDENATLALVKIGEGSEPQ
ncbi:MAG: PfkB family carbohydrate kinase [Treponema sp.]|nr:PfkB family carbohydrate kinase [Treponema sp.]